MTTPDPRQYQNAMPHDPNLAYDPRYADDPRYPYVARYPHDAYGSWYGPQQGQYAPPVPPSPSSPPSPSTRSHRGRTAALVTGAALLIAGATAGGIALSNTGSDTVQGSGIDPSVQLPTNPGSGSGNGSSNDGSNGGNGTFPFPDGGNNGNGGSTGTRTSATATQSKGIVTIVSVLKYQNAESAGTGMVLTSDGEVLTNNHVIRGATSVTVKIAATGTSYRADVIGTAPSQDVAVLQLRNASGLQTAKVGDASDVSDLGKGDAVTGVGNAGGTGRLVSAKGSVTALEQSITASDEGGANPEQLTGLIGVDAGIVSGDSGGPLYDSDGDVIGMNTAASSNQSNRQGGSSAYAIPIDDALNLADQIESGVQTSSIHIGLPGFIGVGVAEAQGQGAGITSVLQGGPAATAGITPGSVVTAVGGRTVTSSDALKTALSSHKPGSSVSITWTDSSGQSHSANVKLMTGPAD